MNESMNVISVEHRMREGKQIKGGKGRDNMNIKGEEWASHINNINMGPPKLPIG